MKFKELQAELSSELVEDIIPYWLKLEDNVRGGFVGRVDGKGNRYPYAERGGVLAARIAWSYSAAARVTGKPEYFSAARRAVEYLIHNFYDPIYGGTYWAVSVEGNPTQTKKQFYALGFAVYALSEYTRATGDQNALNYAIAIYNSIEEHSYEPIHGGYIEALARDWSELEDVRLSEKDAPERKTMNTHLHILEPYTNLYRVWKDEGLKRSLTHLIELFLDKIIDNETHHLKLFFTDDWQSTLPQVSYGHDIEASWLLYEAAEVLGDPELCERVKEVFVKIADAAAEGLEEDGSMIYEHNLETGHTDTDRHWWVQAEAVVGFVNVWKHTGDEKYLELAVNVWEYIKSNLLNLEGEWWWSIKADGRVNKAGDRAGMWKCPYHNSRMCVEVMSR